MSMADVSHGQASKLRRLVAAVRLPLSKKWQLVVMGDGRWMMHEGVYGLEGRHGYLRDHCSLFACGAGTAGAGTPGSFVLVYRWLFGSYECSDTNHDTSSFRFDGSTIPPPVLKATPTPSTHLPPELWMLIIRHATSGSASYDDGPEPVSFLSLPHNAPRLASHRALMRQKARLTLVCRAWHAYAQEVLFEFVWLSRERQARLLAGVVTGTTRGKYIRRLHVETPALERCSAADLRTILDHAPALAVYSDYRSVRRRNTLSMGAPLPLRSHAQTQPRCSRSPPPAHVTTFSPHTDPASPDSLLAALARPGNSLRRLSWTNYDDLSFHLRLSPLLLATSANLEFLELNFCSQLDASRDLDPTAILPCSRKEAYATSLTLPALKSLKVTLDNATFAVLATWDMPELRNLSVLAADFSYYSTRSVGATGTAGGNERTPSGFELFFLTHGEKVEQLELGHSSSVIEEHWVTAPPRRRNGNEDVGNTNPGSRRIPLSTWCPNLSTFICSADAEWNWQNPDWIAPHVLLPAHPGVRFIGVRDIGKRIVEGLASGSGGGTWGGGGGGDGDFFMLGEQIGSLLRREAFPSLLYVRDMSYGSDVLRRGGEEDLDSREVDFFDDECPGVGASGSRDSSGGGGRIGYGGNFSTTTATTVATATRRWPWARLDKPRSTSDLQQAARAHRVQDRLKVLRFWGAVLDRCREGGVWLEDWRGVNVTVGDLRRAGAAVVRGAGAGAGADVGVGEAGYC
ncbi:hypothetical protein BDZ94DRAFT_1302630 [Collybia nuda]|uniref:Uncharacterized protein n=1 Tax=Collybia nuda TaxID=64659 RepID=A0A9P5XSQ8_9AGAR|nr:hypothetical protein BDZ94DRAFT_1302630 [Collybia nuda]